MKKIIILLLFVIPFISKAQDTTSVPVDTVFVPPIDSSRISQTITLSQLYHTYIIGFIGTVASVDNINYLNQLRGQYDTSNMNKSITVTVPSYMIVNVYRQMAAQPEGQCSSYNNAILDALVPQISNSWLMNQIGAIRAANFAIRDAKVGAAEQFIMSINIQ
jgi:hypothetical protein